MKKEAKTAAIQEDTKPKKQTWGGDDDMNLFEDEMSQPKTEAPKEGEELEHKEPLDDEDFGEPQSTVIEDADMEIGKGVIYLFDDLRADAVSLYVTGDLSESERFLRYKDLDNPRHRTLSRAAALLAKQYRLERSPLLIVLITLIVSSLGVFKEAYSLKKQRKTAKEAAKENAPKKEKGNVRKLEKVKLYNAN